MCLLVSYWIAIGVFIESLEPQQWHESDVSINVINVNIIRIECNVTTGIYSNDKSVHTIHEFLSRVSSGYKIEKIKTDHFLPIIIWSIIDLMFVVDQDRWLLDFCGEQITLGCMYRNDCDKEYDNDNVRCLFWMSRQTIENAKIICWNHPTYI